MNPVHTRLRRAALACAVATLAPAAIASAGTPFTIGTTDSSNGGYSIAMHDGTGTAYVVFKKPTAGEVGFCRLPRAATACSATTTLTADTDPSPGAVEGPEQPWIFRNAASGELTIVDVRYVARDIRVWNSLDDGVTWSPHTLASDSGPGTDSRRPAILDGGLAAVPSFNTAKRINRIALDGTGAVGDTAATLSSGAVMNLDYDLMAAQAAGTELVATAASLTDTYSWLLPTGQNADVGANWSANPTLVAAGEKRPQLVSGGGTTFLFTEALSGPQVRKWTGAGFGAPTALGLGGVMHRADASGDGDSALVASSSSAVRVALSTDGTIYSTRVIANEGGDFPDIAVDNVGQGFAIWKGAGNALRVADLTDIPPPSPVVPPTPGPTPTPIPTPVPGTIYRPGGSPGVATTQTGSGSGATYTVTGPRTCVPRGGRFRVTLKFKKQKRKGNVFVKVTKVDFSINGKIKKTDRTVPFRQTLTATATAAKGSTITMRARAFIKMRKTKRVPKKSIFLRIRICS